MLSWLQKEFILFWEFNIGEARGRMSACIQIKKQREVRFCSKVLYLKIQLAVSHPAQSQWAFVLLYKDLTGKELQRTSIFISDGRQLNQKEGNRIEIGLEYFIIVSQ